MADRPMRTIKRQIIDTSKINKILDSNIICRIALHDRDEGYPYIVPIDYGYEYNQETGELILYFHSAKQGRKIDLINADNRVGFEIDETLSLKQSALACEWGMYYNSIIGRGDIFIIDDKSNEKKHGLDVIMRCHGRSENLDYDETMFKQTLLLKLVSKKFTVKSCEDRNSQA